MHNLSWICWNDKDIQFHLKCTSNWQFLDILSYCLYFWCTTRAWGIHIACHHFCSMHIWKVHQFEDQSFSLQGPTSMDRFSCWGVWSSWVQSFHHHILKRKGKSRQTVWEEATCSPQSCKWFDHSLKCYAQLFNSFLNVRRNMLLKSKSPSNKSCPTSTTIYRKCTHTMTYTS